MPLTAGTRVGPYEVLSSLGAGGMGEVYRATDTRLHRVVALKALHALFTADPERVERFDREAQLLASINHPNIGAIHGLEEAAGEKYLVLEFIDGLPLSEVLANGALPVDEALAFARQIADALAAAHERGIIHRDIKPGNIMVTPDGVIKVLDFGLGKALDAAPGSDNAKSPTMTRLRQGYGEAGNAGTEIGVIIGTAAYMSPEQAKGRAADRRSDVWGFGCVLYEMLTGKRAFDGEDITETLAAIVRGEPDWHALPSSLSPSIRELVQRCLVRNRGERVSDMSVVRYLLSERPHVGPVTVAAAAPTPPLRATPTIGWPTAVGLVMVTALATAGAMWALSSNTSSPGAAVTRLSIALPEGDRLTRLDQAPVAISPDGSTIAYAARRGGTDQLFVRSLSESEPKPLAGAEGAKSPFFSPDGRWIAFFAQGKLKKIAVGGAGVQVVTDVPDARGGSWATDDQIYFAPTNTSGIWRVPASGGTGIELTHPDAAKGEISHFWPHVLPGHQTMVFTVRNGPGPDERVIVSQSLSTGERQTLVSGGDMPRVVSTGHLVYGRLDGLFAVPWTASDRGLSGAVPITLPELSRLETEGASDYAVSDNGTLVYLAGGPARTRNRLVWVDRSGKSEALSLPERDYESVAISPDGRQAVIQMLEDTVTLWMLDLERQAITPFQIRGGSHQAPVWSADGTRIIYRATRTGFRNLYWKSSDGTGGEERLTNKSGVIHTASSVSSNGKWLLFSEAGSPVGAVWALSLDAPAGAPAGGDRVPQSFLPTGEAAINGQLSPDGKWAAYESPESGRAEVYVRPFPGPGPRKQVSTTGGSESRWSRDGRALYFRALDGKLMAVDVTVGAAFSAGVPRLLWAGSSKGSVNGNTAFDVTPSGRILLVQPGDTQDAVTRIEVVLNWISQLRGAL